MCFLATAVSLIISRASYSSNCEGACPGPHDGRSNLGSVVYADDFKVSGAKVGAIATLREGMTIRDVKPEDVAQRLREYAPV